MCSATISNWRQNTAQDIVSSNFGGCAMLTQAAGLLPWSATALTPSNWDWNSRLLASVFASMLRWWATVSILVAFTARSTMEKSVMKSALIASRVSWKFSVRISRDFFVSRKFTYVLSIFSSFSCIDPACCGQCMTERLLFDVEWSSLTQTEWIVLLPLSSLNACPSWHAFLLERPLSSLGWCPFLSAFLLDRLFFQPSFLLCWFLVSPHFGQHFHYVFHLCNVAI
jgi:hypothetical protein